MTLELPTRDGYDLWAEHYDGDGNPLVALEEPVVAARLGDVRGLDVLDIGCGTGRHALALAAAGARTTAVDFSAGMLARARAKPGAEAVRFVVHDLAQPLPFADAVFDRIVCGLVLEHIADLRAAFAEMRRVLRPAGLVVASNMHPAMMLKGVQARFHDPATGREIRPASRGHQISDYVVAALAARMRPVAMSEHAPDAALADRLPRAGRYVGWPMLLVLVLAPEG
jgi:malonyl-CoA O-methyltransferase